MYLYLNLDLLYNTSDYFVYPVLSYYKFNRYKYTAIFHNYTFRMICFKNDFEKLEYWENGNFLLNYLPFKLKGFHLNQHLLKFLSTI